MIETIIKIAGSLLVGGVGMVLIVMSFLIGIALVNILYDYYNDK